MILRFRLANFRSFRDEAELSLVATALGGRDAMRVAIGEGERTIEVLPVAGVFGANASGKSNLTKAIRFLCDAVRWSHARWEPGQSIPRQHFCLDEGAEEHPTLVELDFVSDDQRYQYGFECNDARFISEWLYTYPKGRQQILFERDGPNVSFGKHLLGTNRVSQDILRPNSLFLSAAASANHSTLTPLYSWFRDGISMLPGERGGAISLSLEAAGSLTRSLIEKSDQRLDSLLRHADLGISGVELASAEYSETARRTMERILLATIDPDAADRDKREQALKEMIRDRAVSQSVKLLHQSPNGVGTIDFDEESVGTRTWFTLIGYLLQALDRGTVLMVDEFDANLHPLLMAQALRLFQDLKLNTKGAQLVFTAHETTPLGTMTIGLPLGRDQVWLAEKDNEGVSHLIALSDFRPRKGENLQKGYLQGRYGGTPKTSWFAFAESLLDAEDDVSD